MDQETWWKEYFPSGGTLGGTMTITMNRVSKGVSGQLRILDTMLIIWMEWKPIRLWFESISTLPVYYNTLKFCLDRFKDCRDSPRFVRACREYFV